MHEHRWAQKWLDYHAELDKPSEGIDKGSSRVVECLKGWLQSTAKILPFLQATEQYTLPAQQNWLLKPRFGQFHPDLNLVHDNLC